MFDLDGTIFNTNVNIATALSKEYDVSVAKEDIKAYDITEVKTEVLQLSDIMRVNEFFAKYHHEIIYEAALIDGFMEYYNKIKTQGDKVLFVTARHPRQYTKTYHHLKSLGIDMNEDMLHCSSNNDYKKAKQLNLNPKFYHLSKTLKLDMSQAIVYEDKPDTLDFFYDNKVQTIKVNQPYNINSKCHLAIDNFTELL